MATNSSLAKRPEYVIRELLIKGKDHIMRALPQDLGLDADNIISQTMSAVLANSDLLKCTPLSILQSVIEAAQLGLVIGGSLGQAYIVPYKNIARFQPGYRGLITLAYRSERVSWVASELVFHCDTFQVWYGTDRRLIHEPDIDNPERGKYDPETKDYIGLRGAYSVFRMKDGSFDFEHMPLYKLHALRKFSKSSGTSWSPWNSPIGLEDMYRKCPIRKLAKRMPLSPQFNRASAIDEIENETTNDRDTVEIDSALLRAANESRLMGQATNASLSAMEDKYADPTQAQPTAQTEARTDEGNRQVTNQPSQDSKPEKLTSVTINEGDEDRHLSPDMLGFER